MTDLNFKQIYSYLNNNFNVSRETYQKLEKFTLLLEENNSYYNLIGKNTIDNMWERHIIDAIQLLALIEKNKLIIDFGSGAGIPGLILSICGRDVISVESIAKKIRFQEKIKDEFGLNVKLINDRVENIKIKKNIIVVARAVAPLEKLFQLSNHLLLDGNKALFMKGRNYKEEINKAEKKWKFKFKEYKSKTSKDSVILSIKDLKWKL
ncbi:MAG: 16S rRNA (guanine(527)-N(7))-methyltransferase RsmG [Rickettsiales bacterium]|nr:16S rRNA (guanine(527)-N(7))-methyltransferase RsmG [Rickettsiales bacterium]